MPSAFGTVGWGTYAPDRVLDFRARLDVFVLLRAGALVENAITNWRFESGLLLRLAFHPPNLIVEQGSQRQQVAVSWYSPCPPIVRPHLHCPTCGQGRYALHEVGGIFTCRICGELDYACRHINRHTPQLNQLARLRRKIRADPAPFSPLPPLSSLRPTQRKIFGQILALEQGVVASMGGVADDLEARAKKSGMLRG
jgi:hypothetical protein